MRPAIRSITYMNGISISQRTFCGAGQIPVVNTFAFPTEENSRSTSAGGLVYPIDGVQGSTGILSSCFTNQQAIAVPSASAGAVCIALYNVAGSYATVTAHIYAAVACINYYSWSSTQWSTCSTYTVEQRRSNRCIISHNDTSVDSSMCAGLPVPATTQSCTATTPAPANTIPPVSAGQSNCNYGM
jgi:hypothetical protein